MLTLTSDGIGAGAPHATFGDLMNWSNNNPNQAPICQMPGCGAALFNPNHTLCYSHWCYERDKKKKHEKLMNRGLSPSRRFGYNRLIGFLFRHFGKPLDEMDEQTIIHALVATLDISVYDAKCFVSSPHTRGMFGWTPSHELKGQEYQGFEWAMHKNVKWYRSLNEPGPWIRYG